MKWTLSLIFCLLFGWHLNLHAKPGSSGQAKQLGTFDHAIAISVNPSLGDVFVLDIDRSVLHKFDAAGKFVRSVGGPGIDRDGFAAPTDLSAADGINVFVADRGNQRIVQYDRWLNYVTSLKVAPSQQPGAYPDAGLWRPISVSVSPQGELFILEETQRQVIRINPFNSPNTLSDLSMLLHFGGFSSGRGNLLEPYQIDVNASGLVFVSDVQQKCVAAYDQFGNYITQVGRGVLHQPKALATAKLVVRLPNGGKEFREYLFVVDRGEIIVFSAEQNRGFLQVGVLSADQIADLIGHRAEPVDLAIGPDKFYLLTETELFSLPLDLLGFGE
ncbi:MAG: hypothetical protein HGB11_03895 [Chlorobiales bacterium]|nr:hypothetical protein [Chlorobiales bacterium]